MSGSGSAGTVGAVGGLPLQLVRRDGSSIDTSAALAGADYIGLYFSAHWCGPCKRFTPEFAKWFSAHSERIKLSTVFVSADHGKSEFDGYFKDMPWDLAVPFGAAAGALSSKYKVAGIPTLIILDKEGKVVCKDGVEKLATDPAAVTFPWKPKAVWDLLADAGDFVDKAGKTYSLDYFKGLETVGLYFSAHWCPPCRGFTPDLAAWYTKQTGAGGKQAGKMDIIFVSSDRDAGQFTEYLNDMPWKALAFAKRDVKAELSALFGVSGIPTLVFIDAAGNTITTDGRSKVDADPEGFPWPPKARDVLGEAVSYINDSPTLVMFTDTVTDAVAEVAAVEALDAVASKYFVGGKVDPRIRFALANTEDMDAVTSVRQFLGPSHQKDKDGEQAVRVTLINVPARTKYLFAEGALKVPTVDELTAFVESYLNGSAHSVPIKS